jgi:hypothetical protein
MNEQVKRPVSQCSHRDGNLSRQDKPGTNSGYMIYYNNVGCIPKLFQYSIYKWDSKAERMELYDKALVTINGTNGFANTCERPEEHYRIYSN